MKNICWSFCLQECSCRSGPCGEACQYEPLGRVPQWGGSWPAYCTRHLQGNEKPYFSVPPPSLYTHTLHHTHPSPYTHFTIHTPHPTHTSPYTHFTIHTPQLDSTWIIFNHPPEEKFSNGYAGFLMALGLHGHLASLSEFHLYNYLQEKHELTVVGLLLGISAARLSAPPSPLLPSLISLDPL